MNLDDLLRLVAALVVACFVLGVIAGYMLAALMLSAGAGPGVCQ